MSEKDATNLYLRTDDLENAVENGEWKGPSHLVNTLVSAYLNGNIDVSADGETSSAHTGDHTSAHPTDDRIERLEERMDTFVDEAKPAVNENAQKAKSLRREVEKLKDRVEQLENIAQ